MADADNATRAPESDAQETSAAPSAPVVGEHCVTDRPTRMFCIPDHSHPILTGVASGQASTGEIIKLNDVDVRPTGDPIYTVANDARL